MSKGKLSWGQFPGYQFSGGNYPGRQLSGGQLSWGTIVLGGSCPGGNYPGGNCPGGNYPGGNCPRTLKNIHQHKRFVLVIVSPASVHKFLHEKEFYCQNPCSEVFDIITTQSWSFCFAKIGVFHSYTNCFIRYAFL